jgi:hypothetical protein
VRSRGPEGSRGDFDATQIYVGRIGSSGFNIAVGTELNGRLTMSSLAKCDRSRMIENV